MVRVVFVCLGNICRSPLAEVVLRHKAAARGVSGRLAIESRGTGAWHVGEPMDARMQRTAARHGVTGETVAQRFRETDYDFDLILSMDPERHRELLAGAPPHRRRHIVPFRRFDPEGGEAEGVPDPYYGGEAGFETVYEIVDRTCEALLDALLDGSWEQRLG
ncbi:MAG: low molecular weight phosphotyrosine protein phosphatase [Deltaproteobacteria bacterium]|nr:MAG: low molecular weight phosphotyrosine protein phosphatase [Deltaproteobacteria bacterium]